VTSEEGDGVWRGLSGPVLHGHRHGVTLHLRLQLQVENLKLVASVVRSLRPLHD